MNSGDGVAVVIRTWLVNYANEVFARSQKLNSESGLRHGRFDQVMSYGPHDIDADFRQKNADILEHKRGNGYWLWKPYFIRRTLSLVADDDYVFYCDSGAIFIDAITPLVDVCDRFDQDVMSFELSHQEGHWTKRDAFVLMNCDDSRYVNGLQRLASFSLWRNSETARRLADEWLFLAQDKRMLTDMANTIGLPNHPGFREHRHDQSIFSLLTKKSDLRAWRDPSQWGNNAYERYPDSAYGQLIQHTRRQAILR